MLMRLANHVPYKPRAAASAHLLLEGRKGLAQLAALLVGCRRAAMDQGQVSGWGCTGVKSSSHRWNEAQRIRKQARQQFRAPT